MKKAAILVVLVSLVSCGGESPRATTAQSSPSPTPVATSPSPTPTTPVTPEPSPEVEFLCPNEGTARQDASLRTGGVSEGDVDGDGATDEVWTVVDPDGPPGCVGFVVVRRNDGSLLSSPLPFETLFGTFDPRIHALVDLSRREGYEISAYLGSGASTQFLALYTVSGNLVAQLKIRGRVEPEGSIFGSGGSVGHLDAVDCIEGHLIVSSAVPSGDSVEYDVRRRDFEVQGLFLVPRGKPQKDRIDLDELDGYPEFASSPLGSCPQA